MLKLLQDYLGRIVNKTCSALNHNQRTLAMRATLSLFAISLLLACDTGFRQVAGVRSSTGGTWARGGAATRGIRSNHKQEILRILGVCPFFLRDK